MQDTYTTTSANPLVSLSHTLQTLREQETVDILVKTTLDYLRTEFNYALLWIGIYDRLSHRLRGIDGELSQMAQPSLPQQFALSPGDIMEQTVIQQAPVQVADLREESRAGQWQTVASRYGIQGTVVFPLCHRHLCFGVVVLGSTLWGDFPSVEQRSLLSMLFGELAMGLHQAEMDQQRERLKRPHEPLLEMMSQLQESQSLDDRLRTIVATTQQFLLPARTHIYWYDGDRALFWLRTREPASLSFRKSTTRGSTSRQGAENRETTEIPLAEFSGFHKTLCDNRIVAIGEAYSSLKADATSRLMAQIGARSLLAAPILSKGKLLGFLSVEGTEARIWQEGEKDYIRGAAQLVALTTPLSHLQERMAEIELDRDLTIGLPQGATSLKSYSERLSQRLHDAPVLVFSADSQTNQIELVSAYPASLGWEVGELFPSLSFVDWQLLQHSEGAIALQLSDDFNEASTRGGGDMRFTSWQPLLIEAGVRSPLIANTEPGQLPKSFVVIAEPSSRVWTTSERELLTLASRQVGQILRSQAIQENSQQNQQMVKGIRHGLDCLANAPNWQAAESSHLHYLAEILESPFVGLVTWEPGLKTASLSTLVAQDAYQIPQGQEINVKKERLLQKVMSWQGVFGPVAVTRLPAATQTWLEPLQGLVLRAIALQTITSSRATGVILVADPPQREWGERQVEALELLAGQLAWGRRAMLLEKRLNRYRDRLDPLNWYKQHRLEELYRGIGFDIKQLTQLTDLTGGLSRLDEDDSRARSVQQVRHQELLRHLSDNLNGAVNLLKYEQWRLQLNPEPISIVRLFSRVLERVEPATAKRQIWMQVHRDQNVTLYADLAKFELVFVEVLLAACRRSPTGGRIDIWYRSITEEGEGNQEFVELSVTDSGEVSPRILGAFQPAILSAPRENRDLLVASPLDRPPGLELIIFERLMRQMGGDFLIEKIEDGRIVSRLLVPTFS